MILDPINKVLNTNGLPSLTTPVLIGSMGVWALSLPFTSSKVHPQSSVRMRNLWFVVNRCCNLFGLLKTVPNKAKLIAVHEQVLDEEVRDMCFV